MGLWATLAIASLARFTPFTQLCVRDKRGSLAATRLPFRATFDQSHNLSERSSHE